MEKKIIITGASGFLGKNLLNYLILDNSFTIYALCRNIDKLKEYKTIHKISVDLFDSSQMEKVVSSIQAEYIIHTAWITKHGVYQTSLENFDWLKCSYDLAIAFKKNGGKYFLGIGSCLEYELNNNSNTLCSSMTPRNPSTIYGKSKNYCFEIMRDLFKESNIKFNWARIFFMVGENEPRDKLISSTIYKMLNKETIECKSPNSVYDFIDVNNVAEQLVCIIKNNLLTTVDYNICTGIGTSVKTLIETILLTDNYPLGKLKFPLNPPLPNYIVGSKNQVDLLKRCCKKPYEIDFIVNQMIHLYRKELK